MSDRGPVGAAATVTAVAGMLWRRLRRDPLGLVFTLALPVAVSVVMGTIYVSESGGPATIGAVVDPADPLAADLVARLDADALVEVRPYVDRAALDRAVRLRHVDAGVVVPAGAATVELVGPPGVEAPSGVRAVVEAAATRATATARLAHALEPGDPDGAGRAAAEARLGPATSPDGERHGRSDAAGEAVLATLVLFVFLNTVAGAASWAEARELGVVDRLRSTPARPGAVAAGFGLGLVTYAVVQAAIVLAVGGLLYAMPLRSPGALVALVVALALAAGGAGLLVATVLPSGAAGTTVAGLAAFVLAMLGGCLWPLEIVPPALAAVGRLTPHFWAVDGLQAAAVRGAPLAAVAGSLGALAAVATLTGTTGAWRLARSAGRL